ncbi:DUF1854 domain-containing protein [Glaciimonas sp. PCH181]|uniref:cyanophycin metabolism-associated DUF1854 family protein n=1 Tax=Glaciimonas sp. PCH181 TaxID=2133943 RepID=UPI000D3A38EC|nr:DUF1854 domain-containing protein [Glaciimonas sp. PCH181]PUA20735.1 DUF1854 domain-containing protein [Glaciimonas sp. PCH181]
MTDFDFRLSRNAFGRLVFTSASGEVHEGALPVRAFPISAADEGLSLVAANGQELAWIDRLSELPDDTRAIVEEELARREFMPEISRILHVSSYTTPSNWTVATNRGEATFTLKGEEDIRRLAGASLLIADNHGVHFVIRDLHALDKVSRKILDRFL